MNLYFLSFLSSLITLAIYIPYIRSVVRGASKPHLFSWLIWSITQSIATYAVVVGGGGLGALGIGVGAMLIFLVFLMSFRYGYKKYTRFDIFCLFVVVFSLVLWWMSENILYSIIIVSFIDFLGFLMTSIKTWKFPNSEDPTFWFIMGVATLLSILSTSKLNLLTMLYPVTLMLSFFMVWLSWKLTSNRI